MALLFMDGFEQYSAVSQLASGSYLGTSPMPALWGYVQNSGQALIDNTVYRTVQPSGSAKSIRFYYSGSSWSSYATLYTRAVETDLIVGFVVNSNSLDAWRLRLGSANTGSLQGTNVITLRANTSGQLVLENNRTAANLITSAGGQSFYSGVWHYVELKISWGASASAEIRLDGLTVGSVSGVDTRSHASDPGYNQLCIGAPITVASGMAIYIDDFYLCNTSGATNNNFLGPISVYTLYPTSNGAINQFTPTGAVNNWEAVKEQNHDSNATYVASSSPNASDRYNVTDIGAVSPSTIYGVTVNSWSIKMEASGRQIRHNVTVGGNTANGSAVTPTVGTYMHAQELFATNPSGGSWTKADVDAMEIGIEGL